MKRFNEELERQLKQLQQKHYNPQQCVAVTTNTTNANEQHAVAREKQGLGFYEAHTVAPANVLVNMYGAHTILSRAESLQTTGGAEFGAQQK